MKDKNNRMHDLIDKELGLFIFRNKLKVDAETRAMLAMAMIAGAQLAVSELGLKENGKNNYDRNNFLYNGNNPI